MLVSAAVFFHDAIYDAQRQDNEELSAQLWEEFASCSSLPKDDIAVVSEFIRRTAKHHGQGEAQGDLALFLDMDLSILGSSPSTYARYAHQIALEYKHIPVAPFCSRRGAVLQGMVTQASVYFTAQLKADYETQARANVALESRFLTAAGATLLPYGG